MARCLALIMPFSLCLMHCLWGLKNSYVAILISENKVFAGGSFEIAGVESSRTHFHFLGHVCWEMHLIP